MIQRPVLLLLLPLLVLSGCTSDDPGAGDAPAIDLSVRDEVALPTVDAAPQPASLPADAEVLGVDEVEPVPPADLLEWVQAGVDDGVWSEPEGIAQALRYVTGTTPAGDLEGVTKVTALGTTGLVRRAADLLAADEVEGDVAAELRRLVQVFSPRPEDLAAASVPADEAAPEGAAAPLTLALGTATALPAAGDALADGGLTIDLTCNDLAAVGFLDAGGLDEACMAYDEKTVDGHAQRVYYPKAWLSDDTKDQAREAAMDALVASAQAFGQLGRHEDVSLVFSLTPHPDDGTEAVQAYFDDGDACPVTVFRSAARAGVSQFKQVIAHEAFHCFQDWNFTTRPYESHRWWLEGSAEYFSNVVYAEEDHEHEWIDTFDQRSLHRPLWSMSYETTVFFQHLANNVGDAVVIDTLEQLGAAGGGSASAGVLAGVGDMQTIWNELVVSWMSDGIADTGGSRLRPATPTSTRRVINAEREFEFDSRPFVATRWSLDFERKHRFEQGYDDGGALHGFVDAGKRTDRQAWTLFPEEVRSTCKEDDRNYFVTTTVDDDRTFTVDVTEKEEGLCDPCLLGAWDMHLDDFETSMRSVMAQAPGAPSGDIEIAVPGGNYYFAFEDDSSMRSQRSGLQVRLATQAGAITYTIDGQGSGTYDTDGETLSVTDMVQGATRVRGVLPGGLTVDQTPSSTTFNFFGNSVTTPGAGGAESVPDESAPYTCEGDLLEIDAPIGKIEFDRIDRIPEPESLPDSDPN